MFALRRILFASVLASCAAAVIAAPVPKDAKNRLPDTDEAVATVDKPGLKETSSNNMKQIGIAVHNFASANQDKLVRNVADKDGKVLLSWRVQLLPFVEEDVLYRQFKLDEAWDSEHNIKLLEKMPKVFDSPRVKARKGYTVYQGFSGGVLGSRYSIGTVPDGTSNTIWCVEATATVPWTKPVDIAFNVKEDLPKFGKAFGDKPFALLLDGSVRIVDTKKISSDTLKKAIMPDDGMVLGADW